MRNIKKLIFIILLLIPITGFGQIIPGVVASSMQTAGSSLLTGLYSYWKCDEAGGTIIDAHDSHNGAPYAISYSQSPGIINTAIGFNGTTSSVQLGNVIKPTTGLSVSFWEKCSTQSAEKFFICHTSYDTAWRGWRISILTDGNFELLLCNGTDVQMLEKFDGGGLMSDNAWHHIVITWDGTTAYTYHDNNKSAGSTWAYTISYASNNVLNFGRADGESNFYNGLLDEIGIWDRALTDSEVTILFNKTPYPF